LFRRPDLLAAVIGLIAVGAALWASTAVMGGVTLLEAKDLFWQMLSSTSIGRAGYISLTALCLALVFRTLRTTAAWREWAVLAALAVFAFVRASMGHAGENGYWTLPFAAEVVHLSAVGVWTGLVAVSAWKVINAPLLNLDNTSVSQYLASMSAAALVAVVASIATGLFNAWPRVGSLDSLLGDTMYANALLLKLALVGVALLLGGYNKFIGLARAQRSSDGVQKVKNILVVESVILILALVAAAVLTSQQPPSAE
jgi:putative copper resistance protein D